jgi:tetratricopeptide (TPR) repeat protein
MTSDKNFEAEMRIRNMCSSVVILVVAMAFMQPVLVAQTVDDGVSLLQKGKYDEAKVIFEQVIKNDENNAKAHYGLGQLYFSRAYGARNLDEAVDQFELAVDLDQNNADYQFMYGAALGIKVQDAGMFKKVMLAPKVKKAFQRAVELNPKHTQARIALAQYYLMAPSIMGGDEDQGWRELDEIVKQDELRGRLMKARFYERYKKPAEAEEEWKTLTSAKLKEWSVWKEYGYFHMRAKRPAEAVICFQKYVELRPDTADSYESLAEALLEKGEPDRAIFHLRKSLEIDKKFTAALYYLGEAYQAKGQKKEAKEMYQLVLDDKSNDSFRQMAETKLKELE